MADSKVWNVSEGDELLLAQIKPKDRCQIEEEADSSEGEKKPKGEETKEPERDVYSFPGDSDPESPPPAPWAHCTFIQRCRKKRVLLRPFSGLGTLEQTLPEPVKQARVSPQKSKPVEFAQQNRGGGLYDFEEDNFGARAAGEVMNFREQGEKREGEEDKKEESELVPEKEIFTCVECSIYFKKQVHLQEHIVEHCQSSAGGGRRLGKGNRFRCVECGWNLPNRLALANHHRRHQESRLKILEEIGKLNEKGRAREVQKLDSKVGKHSSLDPSVMQDASTALFPGKEANLDLNKSPPLSPAPILTPDPAVSDSDTLSKAVQSPTHVGAVSAPRRRFVCTKCNFSTRTSQALANHTKTHNRKKNALKGESPSPGSPSCLASTSLACGHCAFLTSSQTVMREHQKLAHPGRVSISGVQDDESGQHSKSNVVPQISKSTLDSEHLSGSVSLSLPEGTKGKYQQEATASQDATIPDSAAGPTSQMVFKSTGNRKLSIKRKTLTKFHSRLDDDKLSGSEEQDEVQSTEPDAECYQQEANSPDGVKQHTKTQSNTGKVLFTLNVPRLDIVLLDS